jgi:hypothetical protein
MNKYLDQTILNYSRERKRGSHLDAPFEATPRVGCPKCIVNRGAVGGCKTEY